VAIEPVHRDPVLADRDARQVVGEGRAKPRAELDDARFGEGRVHGIGGAEQFQRRAHADAGVLGLDRGRAQHEFVVAARDHIERPARMD
jgi:hypothetical protein